MKDKMKEEREKTVIKSRMPREPSTNQLKKSRFKRRENLDHQ